MLIKLIQIIKDHRGDPCLGEVFLSKESVVASSVRSERGTMVTEAVNLGISKHVGVSSLTILEGGVAKRVIVIGSPREVKEKLGIKNILRG